MPVYKVRVSRGKKGIQTLKVRAKDQRELHRKLPGLIKHSHTIWEDK